MNTVQIVDEKKRFNYGALETLVNSNCPESLRIVTILGPQSSGKSTLLNGLFGTSFAVMDDSKRRQTTKGIWASMKHEILVFDVEGTDGRERGEDQDFERKSALFSLAIAEVLIINIWENSVGLYHGANMNLLRTVMEVNFQIKDHEKDTRTVILFVVRDYAGSTPKKNLSEVLTEDVQKIWSSITQGSVHDVSFQDNFVLKFFFLPHKILQSADFNSQLGELGSLFIKTATENSMFEGRPQIVSPDDFPIYAKHIWDKVDANKDLDLPTERELLAQFRCDESIHTTVGQFKAQLDPFKTALNDGKFVDQFGSQLDTMAVGALHSTSKYPVEIVETKKDELRSLLISAISHLIDCQIKNLTVSILQTLNNSIEDKSPSKQQPFASLAGSLRKSAIEEFNLKLQEADSYPADFLNELAEVFEVIYWAHAQSIVSRGVLEAKKLLRSLSYVEFGINDLSFSNSFWEVMEKINERLNMTMDEISIDCQLSDNRSQKATVECERAFVDAVVDTVDMEFTDTKIAERVIFKFESSFFRTETGLPRIWSNEVEVDSIYKMSSVSAMSTLEEINHMQRPEWVRDTALASAFPSDDLQWVQESSYLSVKKIAERQFHLRYSDAKKTCLRMQTHIPPWVFLLLLVLGWNEIVTVFSSPLYLFTCILIAGIFGVVKMFRLYPYLYGMGNFIARNIQKYVQDFENRPRPKSE